MSQHFRDHRTADTELNAQIALDQTLAGWCSPLSARSASSAACVLRKMTDLRNPSGSNAVSRKRRDA
ncbi:hypothetical protein CDO26_20745 (plasmid) [Sinorhizobium meliloti]|nr:hypothetical protein CDO26_20745 [Sinorhizobium meliloti]ASP95746.1 hypothetical protein CDO25_32730 [Sinorhizobium meliloti]RVG84492.1 hypothetical protein CN219_14645 [Sinorhizobium meliloti]RVI35564.1 hypothetical protein CN197_13450 [Sinorhizobium meliloti]RVI44980.1 hypothetical protein CN196_14180 [Sinorhizobium meliloti]